MYLNTNMVSSSVVAMVGGAGRTHPELTIIAQQSEKKTLCCLDQRGAILHRKDIVLV